MLITAIILMFVVFVALISRKLNIPLILIAMAMGIFFGSDVTGIIYFDDAQLTQRVANVALVFILFAGGFSTKTHNIKPVFEITLLLATGGVLVTALVAAVPFAALTGFGFQQSLLLCVIISSTDAAAIFSILRTRSINKTLTSITEIESAANDPMAIISTVFLLQLLVGVHVGTVEALTSFLWQLVGGMALGVLCGLVGVLVCLLQNRSGQSCKTKIPRCAGVKSPEMQRGHCKPDRIPVTLLVLSRHRRGGNGGCSQ